MWPTPASIVSRGPRPVTSRPSTAPDRVGAAAGPVIASISSLWPLASTPARPTISPARTSKDDAAHRGQAAVVGDVQVAHLEHRLARRVLGLLDPQQHVAADHQARQAALGGALGRHRVDLLAAPQHRHAVGDVEHLVELVRDEHDRRAVLGQRAQHLEQVLRLLRRQHGGRLVEHEHLGAAEQRAQDLHALLGADAEVLDLAPRGRTASPYCSEQLARARPPPPCSRAAARGAARSPSTRFSATVMTGTSMKCWWTMPMPSPIASPRRSRS